ncbi:hypothetical protein CXF83_02645 [Shewanella sp. Choline-02u-19]|jgi:predicted small secreted protein|uniref:hypothetical protein n=1 Tax=unclassified Shewanella TaxID=196818 RepID=UPI000C332325|nr:MULTISPECIES: hypothetical protein [unclassified Shewanella]PKG55198.1 hypothetical protein CXF82_21515 [Shewanella sp. GutDb-MelDb]PKG72842.1 hypothetical protein CXF86_20805 [Shewanella sp. GutCb]PKH58164.1 hypothetical protein CXF84_05890 [Shewanella sp. Bg11-22]PKI29573.1 hypothetical protein CXF83_02645 [Shewanella sp. Choline-02u-19]
MKIVLILSIALLSISTVACSSNTVSNAGCDFVKGASTNAADREVRDSRPGQTFSSDNHDTEIGILSAIMGLFTRQINDDDECL